VEIATFQVCYLWSSYHEGHTKVV
nr:hypothetical protein [Tanacetum cinerariifolium]